MNEAVKTLEAMRDKEGEYTNVWGVCCQLIEIAEREPASAAILEEDLKTKNMHPREAEKKIKEFADGKKKQGGGVCVPPQKAEEILREFYGLPARGEVAQVAPVSGTADGGAIDFMALLGG